MSTAQAVEMEAPVNDIFRAGADAIEDENLGNYIPDDEIAAVEVPAPDPEPVQEAEAETQNEAPPEAQAEESATAEEPPAVEENKPIMIPKARLDKELARRRALEAQLREYQDMVLSQQTAQPAAQALNFDLGDDPKQMFDKVLDGDIETARRLFSDMLSKTAQQTASAVQQQVAQQISQSYRQNTERNSEEQVISDLEQAYDFYNPGSESFDKDAIAETIALQKGFIEAGYTRADAMRQASNYYVTMRNATMAPPPQAAPAPPQQKVSPQRKVEEVQRNIEAQRQQPPAVQTTRAEQVAPEFDLTKMSEEEIFALPEATLRRLRGDFV